MLETTTYTGVMESVAALEDLEFSPPCDGRYHSLEGVGDPVWVVRYPTMPCTPRHRGPFLFCAGCIGRLQREVRKAEELELPGNCGRCADDGIRTPWDGTYTLEAL
jgi:hypothetical protein